MNLLGGYLKSLLRQNLIEVYCRDHKQQDDIFFHYHSWGHQIIGSTDNIPEFFTHHRPMKFLRDTRIKNPLPL